MSARRALVRAAGDADAPAIAAILNAAIAETLAIWMDRPYSVEERRDWLAQRRAQNFPVLAAEIDSQVVGFASYGPFRAYDGYRRTVENSVYIAAGARGRGLGGALMAALLEHAARSDAHSMIAAIGLPNAPSIALHARFGFVEAGVLKEAGFKAGGWRDLLLMQKML